MRKEIYFGHHNWSGCRSSDISWTKISSDESEFPCKFAITIVCLLGCVYGYYIFEAIVNHHAILDRGALLWSAVAFVAGTVFGFGAFFANQENSKLKYFGLNLLPAVFTAEGLDNIIHIEDYSHMVPAVIMKIIIGVVLYLAINRKNAIRPKNILSYVILTVLGIVAFAVLSGGL